MSGSPGTKSAGERTPLPSPRQVGAAHLVLALAILAVFGRVVGFDFVGIDDPGYVMENARVLDGLSAENVAWAFTTTAQGNWHPLTWLSLMLDADLGARRPWAFHFGNLLLHMASSLLLLHVMVRATGRLGESAAVAALFALHPLHVESVAWIAERKDVLSGLFWMLSLLAYLRYTERPGAARYLLVAGCLALGLMAKPMLVTLPLVLLLIDVWPLLRHRSAGGVARLVLEKAPLLLLAAISTVVTVHAQASGGAIAGLTSHPLGGRLANAAVSTMAYVHKTFWPFGLAVYYPYRPELLTAPRVAFSLAVLATITCFCAIGWRRRPYLVVGWLWYLVALLPVIGIVQVGAQRMADRYTYLPLVGLFVAAVWGLSEAARARACPARKAMAAIAVCVLVALSVVAWRQLDHWRDTTSLFTRALAVTEENAVAHNGLGLELYRNGHAEEALPHFQECLRIAPDYFEAHVNSAAALDASGRAEEAIRTLREALRLRPDYVPVREQLGDLLVREGRSDEARALLLELAHDAPGSWLAHRQLGALLAAESQWAEAAEHLRTAARLSPDDPATRRDLGTVLMALGDLDGAERELREAVRLDPRSKSAHLNLGVLLARRGDLAGAVERFSEAVRLDPDDQGARRNLERARAMLARGAP